jgi:hypothetical protein
MLTLSLSKGRNCHTSAAYSNTISEMRILEDADGLRSYPVFFNWLVD